MARSESYLGWVIYHEGIWWQAWKDGYLHLRADTLSGLKGLIRASNEEGPF